jgi:hypothetical protein
LAKKEKDDMNIKQGLSGVAPSGRLKGYSEEGEYD